MQHDRQTRKVWIGPWLVAVAFVHTVAAFLFFSETMLDIVERGVFDTIGRAPMPAAATWFLLFGALLALLGMTITELERAVHFASAPALGVCLLLLTVLGVVLMPASGFWLAFPPAIGLLTIVPKEREAMRGGASAS